jgi:uncharacterized protein YuzE
MKIKYDKEADVLYIRFNSDPISESDQEKPGIIIDYNENGQIVGIEVLKASSKVDEINGVFYEFA